MESFLVSNDFDGNELIRFVVVALNRLTKATFAKKFKDFVSVSYMVL